MTLGVAATGEMHVSRNPGQGKSVCGLQSWAKLDLEKARMGFPRKDSKQVSLGDSRRQQEWAPGQNRRYPEEQYGPSKGF